MGFPPHQILWLWSGCARMFGGLQNSGPRLREWQRLLHPQSTGGRGRSCHRHRHDWGSGKLLFCSTQVKSSKLHSEKNRGWLSGKFWDYAILKCTVIFTVDFMWFANLGMHRCNCSMFHYFLDDLFSIKKLNGITPNTFPGSVRIHDIFK